MKAIAHVLALESDPQHIRLLRRSLATLPCRVTVEAATTTSESFARLQGSGSFTGSARPDLIVANADQPGLDCRLILVFCRNHSVLRQVPFVVLARSYRTADMDEYVKLGADAFFAKPMFNERYDDLVGSLGRYFDRYDDARSDLDERIALAT